jgi:hypothetical protein
MNDNNSKATQIPVWDGKEESWPLWNIKFQSLAIYHDCEDVLDEDAMKDCPKKSELKGLDPGIPKEKAAASLYKANSRLAAIFTLSQQTAHGLGFLEQTKCDEFPSGIVYRALELMKDRYAPNDLGSEILLESEMESIPFRNASDYYDSIIAVCNKYGAKWTSTDHLKQMLKKTQNQQFIKIIMDHLKSSQNDNFEFVCKEISEIQKLSNIGKKKVNGTSDAKNGKEVVLANTEVAACKTCGKRHKGVCNKLKSTSTDKSGDKSGKKCSGCGKEGILEADCWKCHPDKAPAWFKKKGAKNGVTASNVEVTLVSLEEQDFA